MRITTADERAKSTAEIDKNISEDLRELFSGVLNEPIPERFIRLLDQLAKAGLK